jgi:hypothetical protein
MKDNARRDEICTKEAGSQEKKEKKKPEHIHHCPLCDRLKKVVRANLKQLMATVRLVEDEALSLAMWRPYIRIERALSPYHVRQMQKMTDAEAEEYIARKFLANYQPPEPVKAGSRPRLTLIQGGKPFLREEKS